MLLQVEKWKPNATREFDQIKVISSKLSCKTCKLDDSFVLLFPPYQECID